MCTRLASSRVKRWLDVHAFLNTKFMVVLWYPGYLVLTSIAVYTAFCTSAYCYLYIAYILYVTKGFD